MSLIRSEQLRFPLTGSFTGSFIGTLTGSLSGSATNAETASYAHTASVAQRAISASYVSGSNVDGAVKLSETSSLTITASHALTSSFTNFALTASHALTASSADNLLVRGDLNVLGTGSFQVIFTNFITSSVSFQSGSNIIGNDISNTQQITGSVGITGSLTMDTVSVATIPNLTGSLHGTASWAYNAISASYVSGLDTASYANFALSASNADTASYALAVSGGGNGTFTGQFTGSLLGTVTGSLTGSVQGTVTGSLLGTASHAIYADTASFALTASYALNVPETASYAITASHALSMDGTGSGEFKGVFSGSFTGSMEGSASYAFFSVSGSYAADSDFADLAGTASVAQQAISSSTAVSSSTSLIAISSSYATSASISEYSLVSNFASSSLSSSYAVTASIADNAYTASYIATASTALFSITASHAVDALTASYALTSSVMVEGTASGVFSGSFTGLLYGTSSWSETASVAYNLQDTASQAYTASFIELARSASFTVSASYVINASFATSSLSASYADEAQYVSASGIVGFQNMIVSGTVSASFPNTNSLEVNGNIFSTKMVSASEGFTGYLYDTASQSETSSFANSFRIKSGAVILDGGLTFFNRSSSLSGSEINNGLRFRNDGPTGDTWNIFSEDQDRSLRFGITDTTHSAYRINNYLHQVNADTPVNIFSSADGGGGIMLASITYEGQGQPNQVWGMWTTASNYTQYITQSYIDSGGIFIGTASFALNASGDGTASYAATSSWAVSASYTETASYAYTASIAFTTIAPAGRTIFHTQTTPSTNWQFTHSLGTLYPNYTVFNLNNEVILPSRLRSDNVSSSTVNFAYPQSGYVVATVGGGLPALSSSYAGYVLQVDQTGFLAEWRSSLLLSGSQQYAETASYGNNFQASGSFTSFGTSSFTGSMAFTGSTEVTGTLNITGSITLNGVAIGTPYVQNFTNAHTWSVNHGLGNQYVQIQTFDSNDQMFFPEDITLTDAYTASILIGAGIFKTGYAVVK